MPIATQNGKQDKTAKAIWSNLRRPNVSASKCANVVDVLAEISLALHNVARTIDAADVGCSTGLGGLSFRPVQRSGRASTTWLTRSVGRKRN